MQYNNMPNIAASHVAIQSRVIILGGLGLLAIASLATLAGGMRQMLLAFIGFFAGVALYHASFGFTSAWRRMLLEKRSLGLRVQLIMLGVTILVFFPLLSIGSFLGQPLTGFVNSVGLALCVGAFLFGIGMQLGGGCGSGTLFTVGGGSTRMLVTLAAFILGSLIATADPLGWMTWPSFGSYSIVTSLGILPALFVSFACLGVSYVTVLGLETACHGNAQAISFKRTGSLLSGPWPLLVGALALATVNIATLVVAGRPWGITSAFALWGAKTMQAFGFDVSQWPYWQGDTSLSANLFSDITSVMNFGIILGALVAAGLAGKFAPQRDLPMRSLLAALIGGLIMGIGARLATGCNIGAFFSGTVSGSLHGLVWLLFAIPGNAVGVWLRPKFELEQ
jgi:uncharacterized protein